MARLLRFAAVAVLLGGVAAGVSGCTGDADPVVSVSPSVTAEVTPTPSVSPSPTPLSEEELLELIPENARGEDFQSATQFARFFFAMYPGLFAEGGDTELFVYLTGENCGFCENAVAAVAETREMSAYSIGGDITFPDLLATGGLQDDGYWYVADRFQAAATETFGSDGKLLDGAPAYSGEARFRLEYLGDHWRVDEIDLEFDDA